MERRKANGYVTDRSLLLVEADASRRLIEDAEGKKKPTIDLAQRMSCPCFCFVLACLESNLPLAQNIGRPVPNVRTGTFQTFSARREEHGTGDNGPESDEASQ